MPQFNDADEMRSKLSAKISTKSRDEWMRIFDAMPDSCVMPVLELDEAPLHPQNVARNSFVRNQKGKYEPVRSFIQLKQTRNKLTKLIFNKFGYCGRSQPKSSNKLGFY